MSFCTDTRPWDGIEVYSYELAKRFSRMGIDIVGVRISLENKVNEVNDHFKVIDVKTPNLKRQAYHFRVIYAYLQKHDLIKEADVVHAVGGYYLGVRFLPARKIVTVIGSSSLRERSSIKKQIRRIYSSFLYRGAQGYIFPNEVIKKEFMSYLKPKRHVVIPIGIDLDSMRVSESKAELRERLGLDKDEYIFLYLGQLVNGKRLPEMVKAFSLLLKEKPNSRLAMVSWGYLKNELQGLVNSLKIQDRVTFIPPVKYDERKYYYKASDAFLMLGDSFGDGGVSTAVMDALGSGLPILVSKHSPNVEVVKDGINGFCVDPSDVQSVKEAMIRIVEDPNLGKNSLEIAKRYTWEEVAKSTLEFYKQAFNDLEVSYELKM
ncbi:glycosyltransferase family 4 protein [Sulfuracidifex tepidarius]|uniref:glycosyltransferase family 4 protein n=1 Tax=Sulfuracidifex tepidarius TaxID=1294262 RepID=UPI0006CF737E|nr:glycosyltransferase family 4 protein [Sulfuracidifex tepidarius]